MNPLRALAAAFSFLTRLPVPGRDVSGDDLGRAVPWFPLVGAALGAVLLGAARVMNGHLAPGIVAVILVALLAAITGGLHLDGLADTFDALGGGRGDRARMLEIMRDSRIGAHGAAALVLVLAAKIFAIADLLARTDGAGTGAFTVIGSGTGASAVASAGTLLPLFAAPIFARWAVVPLMVFFRYARPVGLGSAFRTHARAPQVAAATLLPLAFVIWAGAPTLAAGAAALAVALLVAFALNRRLDGLTGDVYGAAIELAEATFLVVTAIR